MRPEQRHQFGKLALPMAIATGVVICVAAGAIWVTQAKASSSSTATPQAPLASATPSSAARQESAEESLQRYASICESAVRERRFDLAIERCQEFTQVESLAAKAYASMAVAAMLREGRANSEQAQSAKYAEQAAKLKDPLGQMILAFHALNGYSATNLNEQQTETFLLEAQKGGVDKAALLLDSMKQGRQCREQAKVQLFELPMFCLNRGELRSALKAMGLREQEQNNGSEREVFNLGDLLPGAKQLTLQYARETPSYLLKPALLSYRFSHQDPLALAQTQQRIVEGLRKKYGEPLRSADASAPSQWRTSDGIEIELRHEGNAELLLSYQMASRVTALREQTLAQEQRRLEKLSAQTLKAI
ncbi:hypothetical protein WG899_13140 [Paucibacter sp. AS339]|uniref:hypothetical protein n=1 Tax=Paucibacter hankyongi TaxID=3133434 RepID=UPI0030A5AEE4